MADIGHLSSLYDCQCAHSCKQLVIEICMLAYQSLNSTAPAYISDMLQLVSTLQRQTNLRSATNSELIVPRTRLRVGELAFS